MKSTTREVAEQILHDCAARQIASPEWGTPQKWVTEFNEAKLSDAIDQALQAERERCAKVAENLKWNRRSLGDDEEFGHDAACDEIAAAIREGKPQE